MAIATAAPTSVARLLSSALWGLEAALVTGALDGRVRAVRGVMPRVRGALGAGIVDVICATESASEAAAAGANAVGVSTLREAVAHIAGEARRPCTAIPPRAPASRAAVDLAD